jgi:hypothetical protein
MRASNNSHRGCPDSLEVILARSRDNGLGEDAVTTLPGSPHGGPLYASHHPENPPHGGTLTTREIRDSAHSSSAAVATGNSGLRACRRTSHSTIVPRNRGRTGGSG